MPQSTAPARSKETFDVAVIGGGMIGPAVSLGLLERGLKVCILDEGDDVLRVARGNFGLVWFQGKGFNMPRYVDWTRRSATLYPDFARELKEHTGVDIGHANPGGLELLLGDEEEAHRRHFIGQIYQQGGGKEYEVEFLDRKQVEDMLPGVKLGDYVTGASYSPVDGHVNPLFLLRAMHARFQQAGGSYLPHHRVSAVNRNGDAYDVLTEAGTVSAAKVVIAAGHGLKQLGPPLGLDIPIRPQRGHILVTERTQPILPMPMSAFRQTAEGSIMLGVSAEEAGYDDGIDTQTVATIARRAARTIPALRNLNIVRSWAALRVLTPDKCPVYAQSRSHPGVYAIASHSGVTLAAVNAKVASNWIAGDPAPEEFDAFGVERFDAQKTA